VLKLQVTNARGEFSVPIDLRWREGGELREERFWFRHGESGEAEFLLSADPSDVEVVHMDRVIGAHKVKVHR